MTRHLRFAVAVAAGALVVALVAPGVASAEAHDGHPAVEITQGRIETLPSGAAIGYSVTGRARMVRTAERTFVHVRVNISAPGQELPTTYPAHVHNAPCSEPTFGGGHYQHEAGIGPNYVNDVNEIWPTVNTGRSGRGHGHAFHSYRARPEAMSVVIHYPMDTSIRLACVDLA